MSEAQSYYEGFYINFYSECCGINREAYDKLEKLEKTYGKTANKSIVRWGKEGERLMLFTSKELQSTQFQEFTKKVQQNVRLKLVKVNTLFEYEHKKATFWVHIPPFGLSQTQEKKWLEYLKAFEKENKVEILRGSMINETHAEEDQDKRYELNLSPLSEAKRKELMLQSKKILMEETE